MSDSSAKKHSNLKSFSIIILVVVLWMSVWELTSTAVELWDRSHRMIFYGTLFAMVVVLLLVRQDLVPHLA